MTLYLRIFFFYNSNNLDNFHTNLEENIVCNEHIHFVCKECGRTFCLDDVLVKHIKIKKSFTSKRYSTRQNLNITFSIFKTFIFISMTFCRFVTKQ